MVRVLNWERKEVDVAETIKTRLEVEMSFHTCKTYGLLASAGHLALKRHVILDIIEVHLRP